MANYRIRARSGRDMGTWRGESPAHALASMHRASGYEVEVEEDGVRFFGEDACGSGDWEVEEEE